MLSSQQVQTLNFSFFAAVALWCIGQMSPKSLSVVTQSAPDVAKALHYQPRTPPTVFEPEYMDFSEESQEAL
jgi:hypothetical protein